MYLFQYAMKNLGRNRGRNLLLSTVLCAIVALSGIAWVLNDGSAKITKEYQKQFGSKVTLINSLNAEKLSTKVLLSFGESEYLQKKEYLAQTSVAMGQLKAVGEMPDTEENTPKGKLIASSNKEINDDFRNKTKVIVEGEMFSKPKEVIVSKAFAKLNQLKIKDTITLKGKDGSKDSTSEYTITGIYDILSLGQNDDEIALLHPANEIYTSYEGFLETTLFQRFGELSATFYLKQPKMLDSFQKELQEKGLPESYQASVDEKSYEKAIEPIESIQDITAMFATGVIGLGTFILFLLAVFFIRERKYELGVLRAMGMKKQDVVKVLMYETAALCILSFLLGLLLAQIGGALLGAGILQEQIAIAEKLSIVANLSSIPFTISLQAAGLLLLLTLVAGGVSGMVSIISILRFEPRKILSERN